MNNPEVLWAILLVGYFIFSAVLRGLRQKKDGDSGSEKESEEPERPWWEENWPSETPQDDQEEKPREEAETTSQPQTISRKDREMAGEKSFQPTSSKQSEDVDEEVATDQQEYKKPSHESAAQKEQQANKDDRGRAAYERPENKPFERHQSKPYERKKNSWEEAEKNIYNWQQPRQKKARKKKTLRINARRAIIHDTILNRPYK